MMRAFVQVFAVVCLATAAASAAGAEPAAVAVIIDDLGNVATEGRAAAALPGPVACSILPYTHYAREIAGWAHAAGKEVLLHLPMESVSDMPLGPGGITLDMTESRIKQTVEGDLASLPYVAGVNNHEGSLMTQHPGDMAWILQVLHAHGALFYVDSYTSVDSVAYQVAREQGVPAARRKVFLDDVDTPEAVRFQWQRLLALAHREGFALAIGHPRPATLQVLEEEIPQLASQDVRLVPVSRIVTLQEAHPLPSTVIAAVHR